MNFGNSFRSVVRRTRIPAELLQKLNHVVSPTEFYVGRGHDRSRSRRTSPDLTHRVSTTAGQFPSGACAPGWHRRMDPCCPINGLAAVPGMACPATASTRRGRLRRAASPRASHGIPAAPRFRPCPSSRAPRPRSLCCRLQGATLGGSAGRLSLCTSFPWAMGAWWRCRESTPCWNRVSIPSSWMPSCADGSTQSFQQSVVISDCRLPQGVALRFRRNRSIRP